ANELAPAIADFARPSNGGIIIAPHALIAGNIGQIVVLSNQHHLPSIYAFKILPTSGGLLSYGTKMTDIFRGAAIYTDRILNGENAQRPPGAKSDAISVGDKSQDGKCAGHQAATDDTRSRR